MNYPDDPDTLHSDIEGAAGVALAGLQQVADRVPGKKVAVIVCGGNVSKSILAKIDAEPSSFDGH